MTRAEDRLYITGWEGKNKRKKSCWYDMIRDAVKDMDGTEEIEDGDEIILRREHKSEIRIIEAAEEKVIPNIPSLPTWAFIAPSAEPIPSRPLSPSRPDDDDEEVTSSPLKISQHMKKRQAKIPPWSPDP